MVTYRLWPSPQRFYDISSLFGCFLFIKGTAHFYCYTRNIILHMKRMLLSIIVARKLSFIAHQALEYPYIIMPSQFAAAYVLFSNIDGSNISDANK